MSVTKLDAKTALIVVDVQKGAFAAARAPNPMEQVARNSAALANAFRKKGLPVVLVKVVGRPSGRMEFVRPAASTARSDDELELAPELDRQSEDHIVEKRTWGAFWETGLEQYLKERAVTQVVITGCATSIGVDSTAREAYSAGFNVTIALDAITDVAADAHDNSVQKIFPRISEIGLTNEILGFLKVQR